VRVAIDGGWFTECGPAIMLQAAKLHGSCHPERRARERQRASTSRRIYALERNYYVYFMSNRSKTIYTGVTGHLRTRV